MCIIYNVKNIEGLNLVVMTFMLISIQNLGLFSLITRRRRVSACVSVCQAGGVSVSTVYEFEPDKLSFSKHYSRDIALSCDT